MSPSGSTVDFSFCENTLKSCDSGNSTSQVVMIKKSLLLKTEECVKLAGSIDNGNKWSLINSTDPSEGFVINFNSEEGCTTGFLETEKKNYTTTFQMKCNKWMAKGKVNVTKYTNFDSDACEKTVVIESLSGCPEGNIYAIWTLLQKYKIFFGAALIILGLFEIFLGAKLMIITLFIATCIVTITVIFLLILLIFNPSTVVVWIILGVSLLGGIVLGYFVAKYKRAVLGFLLGGYMGYILGLLLYNVAFIHIQYNPTMIYWMTIILSILIACVFSYFLFEHLLIVSTSFCGAYALIRGISLYAGGFPNESYIIDLINKKEYDTLKLALTPIVYVYVACWLVVCAFGIYFQYKTKSPDDKNNLGDDSKTKPLDASDPRDVNMNTSVGAINKI